MIFFNSFLPIPDTAFSHSRKPEGTSLSSGTQIFGGTFTQTVISNSLATSGDFYTTQNTSSTSVYSTSGQTIVIAFTTTRTDGAGISVSNVTNRGTTVSSTGNLSQSGATTSTTSSESGDTSSISAGATTTSATSNSTTGSATAGLTSDTTTSSSACATSIAGSVARTFTSTSSYSTSYSFASIESSISGTISSTSSTSSRATLTTSTSTTYPGYFTTSTTTVTYTLDFTGRSLSYVIAVVKEVDFSSVNDWLLVPTATSGSYSMISQLVTSTDTFAAGTVGNIGGTRFVANSPGDSRFLRNLLTESYLTTTASISQNTGTAISVSTTYTGETFTTQTYTFHNFSTTGTRTYTLFTTYSSLPFPANSTTTSTENAITTTTATTTGRVVATSTFSTFIFQINVGETANASYVTTAFSTSAVLTTQLISTAITYHSSLRSIITLSSSTSSTVTFQVTARTNDSLYLMAAATSVSTNLSLGTETQITSMIHAQSFSRTTVTTTYIGLKSVDLSTFGSIIGLVAPKVLTGFRNIAAPLYSDTYGSSISVDIAGSTRIPFPILSLEQNFSVYLPVTTGSEAVTETGDQAWTVSYSSNSILATYASGTDTSTVSASWTVTGPVTDSSSHSSSTIPAASFTALVSKTITKKKTAFGGVPDVSNAVQGIAISKGAYLEVKRPNTGGADTTAFSSLDGANRILTAETTNIHIIDPVTVIWPVYKAADYQRAYFSYTQKYIY